LKQPRQCDQRHPICLRCSRNNRDCVFAGARPNSGLSEGPALKPDPDAADSGSGSDQNSPPSDADSPSSSLASPVSPNSVMWASILADYNLDRLNPWIRRNGTSVNHLLHHFTQNSPAIMGQEFGAQFWAMACRFTFLIPTVLSVSACHLRHHAANPGPHRIAELGQESMAISSLKAALAVPLESKDRANALLYTAVMLNAINFASVENPRNPAASWVFSSSADRLGWLDLQLRFKRLEEATAQFREPDEESCQAIKPQPPSPPPPDSPPDEGADLADVPASWRLLLGGESDPGYRFLREPIRQLARLRVLEPTCMGSFVYFGFVSRLEDGFRDLLYDRDVRALWIFGYWLGLIGRFSIWWSMRRVERDWAAVRRFLREKGLEKKGGRDGKMWRALMVDLGKTSVWPSPEPEELDRV
jgi:hypothetical protein